MRAKRLRKGEDFFSFHTGGWNPASKGIILTFSLCINLIV